MSLSGFISSGVNTAGNMLTEHYNRKNQREINEQNIELQREINQMNIDNQWAMWNATNEYNSPAAQMSRFKEAGLNPHLIYGQSNTTSAVDVGRADAPRAEAYRSRWHDIPSILSVLQQKADLERKNLENKYLADTLQDRINQKKLDVQKTTESINKIRSDIKKNGAQIESINLKNQIDTFYKDNIQPLERQIEENKSLLSSNDVRSIPLRNKILDAQTKLAEFEIELQTMEYLVKQENINLSQAQRSEILQRIEESKSRINNTEFIQRLKTYEINRNPYQSGGVAGSVVGTIYDMLHNVDTNYLNPFK